MNLFKNTSKEIIWHTILLYIIMAIYGMSQSVKTVVLPLIRIDLNLTNKTQGLLLSTSWYGYCFTCFIGTIIISFIGMKRTLQIGILLLFIGFYGTILAPSYIYLFITLFLTWSSFGLYDIATNSMGSAIFKTETGIKYNLLHFFYGIGSIIAPIIASFMINIMDESYRSPYYFLLFPTLLMFGLVSFTNFDVAEVVESENSMHLMKALKDPIVWFMGIILGFMEVAETGISDWAGLYFYDVYGYDVTKEGALFASVYFVMFTLSRLLMGFVVEKVGYMKSLYACSLLIMTIMLTSFIIGKYELYILMLLGAPVALEYPTMMSIGVKIWGKEAPMKTCVIIFLYSAINPIFQLVVGYVNDLIGNEWGYRSLLIYQLITFILLLIINIFIGKKLNEEHELEHNISNDTPLLK